MRLSFVRLILICACLASLLGCKPSESEREEVLDIVIRSLAQGTAQWEEFVPIDERAKMLQMRPLLTDDYTIVGWDSAGLCCSLNEDMYEYQLRFSNGRTAVSYVHVAGGRVDKIWIDADTTGK